MAIHDQFFELNGVYDSVSRLLGNRKLVKIQRRRQRSKEIVVSFDLQTKSAGGERFCKSLITNSANLGAFFSRFGLTLKASNIGRAPA